MVNSGLPPFGYFTPCAAAFRLLPELPVWRTGSSWPGEPELSLAGEPSLCNLQYSTLCYCIRICHNTSVTILVLAVASATPTLMGGLAVWHIFR